jgi:hypothetical protein
MAKYTGMEYKRTTGMLKDLENLFVKITNMK